MTSPARGGAGPRWKTLAWAVGIWAFSGTSAAVYGGGHKADGTGLWGEYGYGPHFANHSCHDNDFGYPYFTHGMGCGVPYYGYAGGQSSGYGAYGPYTGAPPYPDAVPAYKMTATTTPAAGNVYSAAYAAPARAKRITRPKMTPPRGPAAFAK